MVRKITLVASLVGVLALWGCGSDNEGKDTGPSTDKGTTMNEAGTPIDAGTPIETGTPTGKTCIEILQCVNGCPHTDQTCIDNCVAEGTTEAQGLFNAFMTCANTAVTGDCAADCTDQSSQECQDCVLGTCGAELDACQGVEENLGEGAGDACDNENPCNSGMECLIFTGDEIGFCSAECNNRGGECGGAPAGTLAACVIQVTGGPSGDYFACGFLCEVQGQKYDCPSTMVCGTEENPAGSGQYFCEPGTGTPVDGGAPIPDVSID
ncbi:MAG: hypothetical protein V1754_04635 [Pseudomonadota bacterium]